MVLIDPASVLLPEGPAPLFPEDSSSRLAPPCRDLARLNQVRSCEMPPPHSTLDPSPGALSSEGAGSTGCGPQNKATSRVIASGRASRPALTIQSIDRLVASTRHGHPPAACGEMRGSDSAQQQNRTMFCVEGFPGRNPRWDPTSARQRCQTPGIRSYISAHRKSRWLPSPLCSDRGGSADPPADAGNHLVQGLRVAEAWHHPTPSPRPSTVKKWSNFDHSKFSTFAQKLTADDRERGLASTELSLPWARAALAESNRLKHTRGGRRKRSRECRDAEEEDTQVRPDFFVFSRAPHPALPSLTAPNPEHATRLPL